MKNALLENPWRFFFPLGVCGLLFGIAAWWTDVPTPAALWHPELMIAGFLLPIGTGFLLYTLPRFLSAQRASVPEAWFLFGAEVLLLGSILFAQPLALALLKSAVLLVLAIFAIRRFPRTRQAPVFAVFVVVGILLGLTGALASLIAATPQHWPGRALAFAPLLQRSAFYHGFFWLLLAGMGSRLFPMLTLSLRPPTETRLRKALAYSPMAWYPAAAALALSFVFSQGTWHIWMLWLRAFAFLFVAWQGWLLFSPATRHGVVPVFTKVANSAVVAGHFAVALFPSQEPALRHLALAGGLALGTVLVVTRVLLAHEGADLIHETRSPAFALAFGAMVTAALIRGLAIFPTTYILQIHLAGALWLAGTLLWVSALLVYLKQGKTEPAPS